MTVTELTDTCHRFDVTELTVTELTCHRFDWHPTEVSSPRRQLEILVCLWSGHHSRSQPTLCCLALSVIWPKSNDIQLYLTVNCHYRRTALHAI